MEKEVVGYVYILTNPSFPDYVKIGYANDVEERVRSLNSTECTPFAFRIYATMEVEDRLKDIAIHKIIDRLAPEKRSVDNVDGKLRVREFYAFAPEFAFELLEDLADFYGKGYKPQKWVKTKEEKEDEKTAKEISKLARNRHHFKEIEFESSLTGHKYRGGTNEDGTLMVIDLTTNEVIPNNSKPTKRTIIGQAILDLGGTIEKHDTLYQRYHNLTKMILK